MALGRPKAEIRRIPRAGVTSFQPALPQSWNLTPRCPIQHRPGRNPRTVHMQLDARKPISTKNRIPPSDASPTTVALDLSPKLNGSSVALRTFATAVGLPRIHSLVADICDRPTAWFGSPSCTAASLDSTSVKYVLGFLVRVPERANFQAR